MAIELHVEPRRTMSWAEFKKEKPRFSIALDGFVEDATRRDPKGPYANYDHHAKVDRPATQTTSAQVHEEINMGLMNTFRENGIPKINIFVNDPDEDTALAVWLLKNHERVINHAEPAINRLVYCEDKLDRTAGAYPLGDTEMRRKMAWVFEPYNAARFAGQIATMDQAGMKNVIEAVGSRITDHTTGKGKELALEGHYEKIGGGPNWTMTKETGPASRMAMYNDGIDAYAALVAEKPDGSYVYTLGRKSVWTPFDIPRIYERLNQEENGIVTETNKWDGSNTIGGSPRGTGSQITPEKLQEIIIDELNN